TKAEVVSIYGIEADRIRVTPLGVDESFRPQGGEAHAAVRARYGLPPRYVLCLGTLEPRKNLGTAIEALAGIREPDLALVIAGSPGWKAGPILAGMQAKGSSIPILPIGFVDESALPALYSGAE